MKCTFTHFVLRSALHVRVSCAPEGTSPTQMNNDLFKMVFNMWLIRHFDKKFGTTHPKKNHNKSFGSERRHRARSARLQFPTKCIACVCLWEYANHNIFLPWNVFTTQRAFHVSALHACCEGISEHKKSGFQRKKISLWIMY